MLYLCLTIFYFIFCFVDSLPLLISLITLFTTFSHFSLYLIRYWPQEILTFNLSLTLSWIEILFHRDGEKHQGFNNICLQLKSVEATSLPGNKIKPLANPLSNVWSGQSAEITNYSYDRCCLLFIFMYQWKKVLSYCNRFYSELKEREGLYIGLRSVCP
jgi:hypothetical protein